MQNQKLPDEFLINVCSTLKLRTSVAVSLAFCLCKSQVRSFVIDALKIIRVKLPELNNNNVISEMNEDIVIGLVQLSRSQEVCHCFFSFIICLIVSFIGAGFGHAGDLRSLLAGH